MMKKHVLAAMAVAMAGTMLFAGCGSTSYTDGTYTGKSSVTEVDPDLLEDDEKEDYNEEANGYGTVELTIEGGKITACTFLTYEVDDTLKGDDYGMVDGEIKNQDFYNKAQKANAARDEYAKQLVETQSVDDVDVISGATINYDNFKEAVEDALSQASN